MSREAEEAIYAIAEHLADQGSSFADARDSRARLRAAINRLANHLWPVEVARKDDEA